MKAKKRKRERSEDCSVALPTERAAEFTIEGDLRLESCEGYGVPFIDGVSLTTYLQAWARAKPSRSGTVKLGQCMVCVIPVRE